MMKLGGGVGALHTNLGHCKFEFGVIAPPGRATPKIVALC